ncbi:DnaJ-domain-containing protein, partial [Teratosphaeria nubilosa]
FHPTSARSDMPDHYATLELPTNATAGEIKKQFYKLSKAYHPDLHRDDSSSSQKFVQISEAHATLGSPEKKARYDRDLLRSHAPSGAGSRPSGSYSSASQPAGSRPPSGLSRRRTQFRGPPPSFYRSGGWGEHSEKRSEHASKASHSHEAQGQAQSGPAGTGPGGFTQGFDNDVRHFDQKGHYRTHSEIERTRHKARRKQYTISEDDIAAAAAGGTSTLANFVMISGVLGLA